MAGAGYMLNLSDFCFKDEETEDKSLTVTTCGAGWDSRRETVCVVSSDVLWPWIMFALDLGQVTQPLWLSFLKWELEIIIELHS